MRIVLLERIPKLGQMGDIVDVKSGYARNYLLPFNKALRATEQNVRNFEDQKAELIAKNLENKKEAETVKSKLDGKSFILIRSASDTGALYGSVSSKDIKDVSSLNGIDISKKQINLEKPIKELGVYKINVTLHPDIISEISINVARSHEEAILQEKGKNLVDNKPDEEMKNKPEIQNLFDDETMASKISDETLDSEEVNLNNESINVAEDNQSMENNKGETSAIEAKEPKK